MSVKSDLDAAVTGFESSLDQQTSAQTDLTASQTTLATAQADVATKTANLSAANAAVKTSLAGLKDIISTLNDDGTESPAPVSTTGTDPNAQGASTTGATGAGATTGV